MKKLIKTAAAVIAATVSIVAAPAAAQTETSCYTQTVTAVQVLSSNMTPEGAATYFENTAKAAGTTPMTEAVKVATGMTNNGGPAVNFSAECKERLPANLLAYAGISQPAEPAPKPVVISEPVVQDVPEAAAASQEVVAEAAPVPTIPVRVANREVRVPAVVDNSAIDSKFRTVNAAIAALKARPTLTTEDANLLTELRGIEGLVGRLQKLDDGQATATLPLGVQQQLAKLELWSTEAGQIAELKTDVTNLKTSMSAVWNWLTGIVIAIALMAAGIIFLGWKKASRAEVREVKRDLAESNKDRKQVMIPEYLEEHLMTLPVGQSEEFDLTIEGEDVRVEFTKCDAGKLGLKRPSVTTTSIKNQTQPMRIEGLNTTLLRHIGAGRLSAKTASREPFILDQEAA